MASEWTEHRLDEVTQLIVDCPHSTPKWTDSGVIVLRNQYIRNGRLDLSDPSYTTQDEYKERIKRATPTPGDLVLTREAPMGEVCQIPKGLKCCLGQRMVLIRVNEKLIDSTYLLFTLQSPYLQHQIGWNEGTGTTVSNIRLPNLRAFQIPIPKLSTQKSIAHILGTLDDKIELNRQMNTTLEAMAQALFKSWFVDFDPVIDNALAAGNPIPEPLQARAQARQALGEQRKPLPEDIQKQFPNRFVFNDDMGWVPKGWEIGVFGDIASHVKDNVKADSVGSFSFYVGLEHIGRKQLFLSDNASGETIESNKSKFIKDDVLFGKLRPYFHKVCIAPEAGICSTDILVFRAKETCLHSYMTLIVYCKEFVGYANLRSTGTRMPRANSKDLLAFPIIVPNLTITEAFEDMVAPIWGKGIHSITESKSLAKLRDTLLPKLLSGELPIPAAEKLVEEAMA